MITRRRFIQIAAALSAGGALAGRTLAAVRGDLPLHVALFDERFTDGIRFGRAFEACGTPTRAIRGDVTQVWYSELDPLWRQRAVPVAGLTTYAPLFVLERLAWDHRMRVVWRGVHRASADGGMEHDLRGMARSGGPMRCDARSSARWSAEIAAAMAQISFPARTSPVLPDGPPAREGGPGATAAQTLYSWIIAPIDRKRAGASA
jgi:hypothetical protein